MSRDENGHVAVETLGTFVPLVLLMISILSLVNIVTVQARIHYALTQTANTLSMYCYSLEVLGMAEAIMELDEQASRFSNEVGEMLDDVNSVIAGISALQNVRSDGVQSGNSAAPSFSLAEQAAGEPMEFLSILLSYGVDSIKNQLFEELARPLVGRYLSNGEISGNEYLKRAGVVNKRTGSRGLDALEFFRFEALWENTGNSAMLDRNGNVKLTVEYEIDYAFGALPLPFGTLKITQTVVTKGWLSGSGEGYQ